MRPIAWSSDRMAWRPYWASIDPMLRRYYDVEWGMLIRDERGLYERISLEAFQSGLSWATILRKRGAFRQAFDDFVPDAVAAYGDKDVERLLADERIVRNKAKISDAIRYALSKDYAFADEGFRLFIDAHVDVALVVDALGPSCESMGISRVETILNMLPDEYASLTAAGGDHPKLSDTRGNLILLEYLKNRGK